jgi:hypothetical protein
MVVACVFRSQKAAGGDFEEAFATVAATLGINHAR